MARPSVSVVMVSWHTGPVLWESVSAALAASDVDELVLINNGNPAEVTRRLHSIADTREDFVLIDREDNPGFARGCNIGAEAAKGEVLLFLNPDAVLGPGTAARMAEAGAQAPRPWVVGAQLTNPDGSEQRGSRRGLLTPLSAFVSYSGLYRLYPRIKAFRNIHRETEPTPDGPIPTPVVSGAAMMLRADDFADLDGLDPSYFLHVEDIDLCRRAGEAGGQVVFTPLAKVMHYGSTSNTSLVRVEWLKSKGFIHYFWKFGRGPAGKIRAVIVAPMVVGAIMGRAVMLWLRGRFGGGGRRRAGAPSQSPPSSEGSGSGLGVSRRRSASWQAAPSTTRSTRWPLE